MATNPLTNISVMNCKIQSPANSTAIDLDNSGQNHNITGLTITNCDIGPLNTSEPIKYGICDARTATTGIVLNANISNNRIHDFGDSVTYPECAAISLKTCSTISINQNKIYQSVSRAYRKMTGIELINLIATGTNQVNTIYNNEIAGSTEYNSGTLAMSSGIFTGIYIKALAAQYTVRANFIRNISMADIGTSGYGVGMTGIYTSGGKAEITENAIGSTSGGNSISIDYSGSDRQAYFRGIHMTDFDTGSFVNENSVGGISVVGNGRYELYGIAIGGTQNTTAYTCLNNTIGAFGGNSITVTSPVNTCVLAGIFQDGTKFGKIKSNLVRGITGHFSGSSSASGVYGILCSEALSLGDTREVSSNTISDIRSTNSAGRVSASGICLMSVVREYNIENNQVSSIASNSTNEFSEAVGIDLSGGGMAIRNNMVSLGSEITSGPKIYGISYTVTGPITGSDYVCQNNSIFIGGTKTSGNFISAAFYFDNFGTSKLEILNNIFVNMRSNSGSASGANYSSSIDIYNWSYANVLFGTGNGYILSGNPGVNFTTLDQLNAQPYGFLGPQFFGDPKFISSTNLHIQPSTPTIIEARGNGSYSPGFDIDSEIRSEKTPHDIGADAGNFTPLLSPTITSLSQTTVCTPGSFSIYGNNLSEVSTVRIGSDLVPFTVASKTQIVVNLSAVSTSGPIKVENPIGAATSSQSVAVYVKPVITSQPQSVTICQGSTSFSVSGTNITAYQWRREGVN
ncbi:MAG: hypothetical protein EOP06_09205, partial [Proteobacteria bacterium]